MLLRSINAILPLLILFHAVATASALSSDPRLIQMVPPESQVVASMMSPKPGGQPDSLLLITANNRIDLDDFFAVTGADASRAIHQVVFAAAPGLDGTLSEHSLLASGHFSQEASFRFSAPGGARIESYRGTSILVVPPLARERSRLMQSRWLAILNSEIAIFGTPASVQRELDRNIANSPPDSTFIERLIRLGQHDETWCLLPAGALGDVVTKILGKLDANFGAIAAEGGAMQYGIHFGMRVEITFSDFFPGGVRSTAIEASQTSSGRYFLSGARTGYEGNHSVVKLSRQRYEEWIDMLSRGNHATRGTRGLH